MLERFLVDCSELVTALAERRDDLAALIGNLNDDDARARRQKVALADSIERLPDFMRHANTTFVDLRVALDEVDPLVEASKPVRASCSRSSPQLRPFARDASPTVARPERTSASAAARTT